MAGWFPKIPVWMLSVRYLSSEWSEKHIFSFFWNGFNEEFVCVFCVEHPFRLEFLNLKQLSDDALCSMAKNKDGADLQSVGRQIGNLIAFTRNMLLHRLISVVPKVNNGIVQNFLKPHKHRLTFGITTNVHLIMIHESHAMFAISNIYESILWLGWWGFVVCRYLRNLCAWHHKSARLKLQIAHFSGCYRFVWTSIVLIC